MKKNMKVLLAGTLMLLMSGGIYLEVSAQREGSTGWKYFNGDNCCSGKGNCYVYEAGNC